MGKHYCLAGDFNARIGDKCDYIKYVDSIKTCTPIDNRANSYCELFIDFLKHVKLCTLNGKIIPELDLFRCHNRKGRSVVDYILTEHKNVNKCIKCKVYNINSILSEYVKTLNTISSSCKAFGLQQCMKLLNH